jgi:hypothetical protein
VHLRRELTKIRTQLDRYGRKIGEPMLWAAYNPTLTLPDAVYNEPGLRAYYVPVYVATLWSNVTESGKRLDDERYDVKNQLNVTVSAEALRNAGVPRIFSDDERIFDLIRYWDRTWSVIDFDILARYQGDSSIINVAAAEVDPRGDYPFEFPIGAIDVTALPEQSVLGLVNISTVQPTPFEVELIARWAAGGGVQLSTGTERAYATFTGAISYVRLSLGVTPTGGQVCQIDILKNGTSIFTNGGYPTLTAGQTTVKVVPDVRNFLADDYFTANVRQAGGGSITIDLAGLG